MRMLRESLGKVVIIAFLAALAVGAGMLSAGSTAVLVKDIHGGGSSSFPSDLTNVNGTVFFTALDGVHGYELWKSDGTEAGTSLVRDIRPGNDFHASQRPRVLKDVNGTLFFRAFDGVQGGLWKSDGTEAGTVRVHDIGPDNLTDVNGTLFFISGHALWKSDGTEAGTVLVKDVGPLTRELTNVNGILFFRGDDPMFGNTGHALWKSDGTEAGTVVVMGTNTGFNPTELTDVNGTLFFVAPASDQELWKSDGTTAGTVLVKDIREPTLDSSPALLTNVNGTLFFTADDGVHGRELWKSDGTEAGTVLVKDIVPAAGGSLFSIPIGGNLVNVNGTLFFAANDGIHGRELWKSDGTEAGTVLVKDIMPGSDSSTTLADSAAVSGTILFRANDGVHGYELWKSDGTEAGTVPVRDIGPGLAWSQPSFLTDVDGTLFFSASDGEHGRELWKVASGTVEPTPTPTNQPLPGDTDGDGCTDEQELGPNETLGGRRDPNNFWDFFDPNRDRAVGLLDFLAVLRHFGTVGDPSTLDLNEPEPPAGEYWVLADRGGQMPNGDPWDELPANGSIGLSDFLSVLRQFGHTCA